MITKTSNKLFLARPYMLTTGSFDMLDCCSRKRARYATCSAMCRTGELRIQCYVISATLDSPLGCRPWVFWEVVGDSGRISFTEDELTTDTFVKNENTLFFFPVSDLGFIDLEAGIECVVPSACLRMVGLRARCDPPLLAPCACFFPATCSHQFTSHLKVQGMATRWVACFCRKIINATHDKMRSRL